LGQKLFRNSNFAGFSFLTEAQVAKLLSLKIDLKFKYLQVQVHIIRNHENEN